MRHYDQGYAQYHQWQGEHLPQGDGPKKIPKLSVGHTHELNETAEHPLARHEHADKRALGKRRTTT